MIDVDVEGLRLDLLDHLGNFLVDRLDVYVVEIYFDALHAAHYGSKLTILNSFDRLNHLQLVTAGRVLLDHGLGWCMVLLIGEQYMVEERTVRWEEGASDFQGLCMPQL